MSVAFVLSVTINIAYCIIKHKRGKEMKYSKECTISEEECIGNNQIYGNLNQPVLESVDESCYEQMSNPYQRNREAVKMEPQETMCYAALDLSPKKTRKLRKKKATSLISNNCVEESSPMTINSTLSRSSIYLNSEQLAAECRREEELIHYDPVRLYKKMHKTRNYMDADDQGQPDCSKFGTC
ncbi:T-cell receptor-associated transmembrane adapter 1 [Pelobates fuscus]|uniref:T-cell receptor-associated transmembrane adapter 1 n=1 Tax=Pelobates fuscus TaxID=191477 RepID=UPI002FE4BAA7